MPSTPDGKVACRAALLSELGLVAPPPGRLLAAIGRLDAQKGWDVLEESLPALVAHGASLALLGDGDAELAERLRAACARHPRRVSLHVGWDEARARRLYAGADAVLIPSRFEPCGLVQLVAQRYGALPVAHRVGGLADTIVDRESGILFAPLSAASLVAAVDRAAALAAERTPRALRRALMSLDVSWAGPAARWETLLEDVARQARARALAAGAMRSRPGRPHPLGATWTGEGTQFALFSELATRVELCLFDSRRRRRARRRASTCASARTMSGTRCSRTSAPDSSTATASTAPTRPAQASAATRASCSSIPTPGRSPVASRGATRCAAAARAASSSIASPIRATARPSCPRRWSSIRPSTGRSDRPPRTPWSRTLVYECSVKGMTARHPEMPAGAARNLSGPRVPSR